MLKKFFFIFVTIGIVNCVLPQPQEPPITKFAKMADNLAESFGLVPHHKMSEHRLPNVGALLKKSVGPTIEQILTFKNLDINMTQVVLIDSLGDVGFQIEADYDLGIGFKNPWFNDMNYLITELLLYFKLGGIAHTALHLYFARVHVWYDVIGSQIDIIRPKLMMDIEKYNEICLKISSKNENLRLKVHL